MPMEKIIVKDFDHSEYIKTEQDMFDFLCAALEEPDPAVFLSALRVVAKIKGMSNLAKVTGLGRESLYKSLSPGSKPQFETIWKITSALGLSFNVVSKPASVDQAASQ